MPVIVVKYLKEDRKSGKSVYRRRVPTILQSLYPGQTMLVKSLGRMGDPLVMIEYGKFHAHIERQLKMARLGVEGLSLAERHLATKAQLEAWGMDPHSSGLSEEERTARGVAADGLLDAYQDARTGDWVGVPSRVAEEASALLGGVPKLAPEPTITDAFRFYLKENAESIPEKRRKQVQRFNRAEERLLAAVGADKALSEVTREDARKWRDQRVKAKVSANTIQREKNDICAVLNLAQSELSESVSNPFSKLKTPKAEGSRRDEREPLPPEVISGVYDELERARPDLLSIWTLLDFTGARPSEVRELLVGEINLAADVPHIIIQERQGRSLKNSWATRKVPLVGAALAEAKKVVSGAHGPSSPAFPRFSGAGGMDRLSQAFRVRIGWEARFSVVAQRPPQTTEPSPRPVSHSEMLGGGKGRSLFC